MRKLGFALSPNLKVRVVQTSSEMASDVDEANGTLWLVTRFVPQEKKFSHIMTKLVSVMIGLDISLFLVFLLTSTSSWSL